MRFLAKPKRASSLWSFGLTKSLQMSAFPLFTPPVCYLRPHTSRLSSLRPCSAVTQGHVTVFTRHFSVHERHIIVCHAGMARLPRRHGTSAAPAWQTTKPVIETGLRLVRMVTRLKIITLRISAFCQLFSLFQKTVACPFAEAHHRTIAMPSISQNKRKQTGDAVCFRLMERVCDVVRCVLAGEF